MACSLDGRNWARIEWNHHNGALLMVDIVGSIRPLIGFSIYFFTSSCGEFLAIFESFC